MIERPPEPDQRPKPETLLLWLGLPVALGAGVMWTWHDYATYGLWTGYGLRVGLFGATAVLLYYSVIRFARTFSQRASERSGE
ncbi:MAG: hypothetical protein AAGF99_10855 [Bacteroidota bacterium]